MRVDIDGGGRAFVRDVSDTGGIFVEGWTPEPELVDVRVDATLPNQLSLSFLGQVVRRTKEGVGVKLELEELGIVFLNRLVALGRSEERDGPIPLCIRPRRPEDASETLLSRRWYEVLLHPESAEEHQRFQEAAVALGQLPAAASRYRAALPAHPSFAEELARVGRLIEFAAFPEKVLPAAPKKRRRSSPGLWLFVLFVGGISLFGLLLVGARGMR